MTLIEDSYCEFVSEYGRSLTHYPHQGYSDPSGNEFWHEDQTWSSDGTTFEGVTIMTSSAEDLAEQGFSEDIEVRVRTTYADVSTGDKVTFDGRDYIVQEIQLREIQGRRFGYRLGLISSEQ